MVSCRVGGIVFVDRLAITIDLCLSNNGGQLGNSAKLEDQMKCVNTIYSGELSHKLSKPPLSVLRDKTLSKNIFINEKPN